MTPAARVQAAIEVLDQVRAGMPAEQALTGWARRSRYAGSGDRAAVRDHVFDVLRCRRSCAAAGGGDDGRALMLGALRRAGTDPRTLFTGPPHGPDPLGEAELAGGRVPSSDAERLDMPDWLWPLLEASLGEAAAPAAAALQMRAPVHLRVNLARTDRAGAQAALAGDGITSAPHPLCATALVVGEGARRVRNCAAYLSGLVELQDAASQAAVALLPLADGMRVLDYCAGGGGKALAMAARARIDLLVHDAAPDRMRDLPARAQRAGVTLSTLRGDDPASAGRFDLVLCDVPCSGSGTWRRAPEAKWRLTPEALERLCAIQADILDRAAALTAPEGVLAYVTCSLLGPENHGQIAAFLARHPGWQCLREQAWPVGPDGDGFFTTHLTREKN